MSADSLVYGLHAVRVLLEQHADRVRQVWLQQGRDDARLRTVQELAASHGVRSGRRPADELDRLTDGAVHHAFLMTREDGDSVGKIFLSGGGARIPGMVETLGRRMNVSTELVNSFERTPVQPGAGSQPVPFLRIGTRPGTW